MASSAINSEVVITLLHHNHLRNLQFSSWFRSYCSYFYIAKQHSAATDPYYSIKSPRVITTITREVGDGEWVQGSENQKELEGALRIDHYPYRHVVNQAMPVGVV